MKPLALPLSLLMLSSACAFTNVHVTPPLNPLATGLRGGDERVVVLQTPFVDARPDRSRCGMQKNGYNMDTASVICGQEPSIYLAELFSEELRAAGFKVVSPASDVPEALRLDGQLLQFFIEPKLDFFTFTPEADISVHLLAKSQSGLVAERDFYVKGEETSLVGFAENFQKAGDQATRTLVKEMVASVISLMDRYPTLGRASHPVAVSLR